MNKKKYHFISMKFLTAIFMALFFAFLLIYVFPTEIKNDYRLYSFESQKIKNPAELSVFKEDTNGNLFLQTAAKEKFESKLKARSFKVMNNSKKAMLSVITSNYLDKINGFKEEEDLLLNELKIKLNNKKERLLQEKRKELEADLSEKLQKIRKRVKKKYSGYSQEEIRDNYLKMINLRIAIEVLAKNEQEKTDYQNKMEQVEEKQSKLLAEKNSVLNKDISAETRTLIIDFNRKFSNYREQLENADYELIDKKETEIKEKLAVYRQQIKSDLNSKKEQKAAEMDQLIAQSREYY